MSFDFFFLLYIHTYIHIWIARNSSLAPFIPFEEINKTGAITFSGVLLYSTLPYCVYIVHLIRSDPIDLVPFRSVAAGVLFEMKAVSGGVVMVCSEFFYVFMFFIFFLNDVKCIYIIQSRVVWSLMDSKSRAAGQVIHRLMSTHPPTHPPTCES